MKKLSKILHSLLAIGASLAVLAVASCSMIDTIEEKEQKTPTVRTDGKVALRIAVENDARTATPTGVSRDSFSTYTLYATKSGEDTEILGTWDADTENGISAYEAMNDAEITVETGTYTFELVGEEVGGATYKATIADKEITASTELSFTLSLSALSLNGIGNLNITVIYEDLNDVISGVTAELYKTDDGKTYSSDGYRINSRKTLTRYSVTGENKKFKYQYTLTDIPAGIYIAVFTYKDSKGNKLGEWPELVWITSGRTSTASSNRSVNQYKITYEPNGGTIASGNIQWYDPIAPKTILAVPEKGKLTFAGWFTSADEGQTLSDTETTSWTALTHAENIILYAKWNAVVSFESNDDETSAASGTMEDMVVGEGEKISALTKNAFVRSGYTFNNWNTEPDGTGTAYEDEDFYPDGKNLVLYAQWLPVSSDSVILTFKANGGSVVDTIVLDNGSTLAEDKIPVSEKTGYNFTSWNTSEDAGKTLSETAFTFENISESTILYAKWTPKVYKIIYNIDEDDVLPDDSATTHTYDADTVLPEPTSEAEAKAEFKFVGWCTDKKLTTDPTDTLKAFAYTDEINLYAKWVRVVYHVIYSASSDGVGSATSALLYPSSVLEKITAEGIGTFDYTIVVHGSISDTVGISDSNLPAGKAKSLLIRGAAGDSSDRFYFADYNAVVLSISTTVPVTLQDILIRNTSSYTALNAIEIDNSKAQVTLGKGAFVKNNRGGYSGGGRNIAGGIAVLNGTLIINDGAEISNNTTSKIGGGVYIAENATCIMNGGIISGNTSSGSQGGGVYNSGTFIMNGGEISSNQSSGNSNDVMYGGGGVWNFGEFTMNGGKIIGNTASKVGGGVLNKGTFTMTAGEISGNTSNWSSYDGGGGGVFNNSTFTMTGGTISGNSSAYGGAVYNVRERTFNIGGSAYIPLDEDGKNVIHCFSGSAITVCSPLAAETGDENWNTPIATIKPYAYSEGAQTLLAGEGVTLSKEVGKFAITPQTSGENTTDWLIDEEGKLKKKEATE